MKSNIPLTDLAIFQEVFNLLAVLSWRGMLLHYFRCCKPKDKFEIEIHVVICRVNTVFQETGGWVANSIGFLNSLVLTKIQKFHIIHPVACSLKQF